MFPTNEQIDRLPPGQRQQVLRILSRGERVPPEMMPEPTVRETLSDMIDGMPEPEFARLNAGEIIYGLFPEHPDYSTFPKSAAIVRTANVRFVRTDAHLVTAYYGNEAFTFRLDRRPRMRYASEASIREVPMTEIPDTPTVAKVEEFRTVLAALDVIENDLRLRGLTVQIEENTRGHMEGGRLVQLICRTGRVVQETEF